MQRVILAGLMLLGMFCGKVEAVQVGYQFTGTVGTITAGNPYGYSIPPGTPVSGHFIWDIGSAATHIFGTDTTGYRQLIPSGFVVNFEAADPVTVVADDYLIRISDNADDTNDIFTVQFVNGLSPPLNPDGDAFRVNGVLQTVGQLRISLHAGTELYSDQSLPSSLELGDFTNQFSFINDNGSGFPQRTFEINSLTAFAVPEPSAWALLLCGAACAAGYSVWYQVSRRKGGGKS